MGLHTFEREGRKFYSFLFYDGNSDYDEFTIASPLLRESVELVLNRILAVDDQEERHALLDQLLLVIASENGFDFVSKAFADTPRWYA